MNINERISRPSSRAPRRRAAPRVALCRVTALLSMITYTLAAFALPAQTPGQPFTQTIPGTLVTFDMIPVPGGEMPVTDKDGKTRTVQVKPFWIGKYEVTWDEYDVFLFRQDTGGKVGGGGNADAVARPSKPYGAPDRGYGHKGYPVISVTFFAAKEYCRWLSLRTGKRFRLPTEIEWEYACRAGAAPPTEDQLDRYAWYGDNSEDRTRAVGKKQPNAWGLYDMIGNAAEWCATPDGKGALRGGSFLNNPDKVGPAARAVYSKDWQATDPQNPKSRWWLSDGPFAGFRIVCDPATAKPGSETP